MRDTSARLVELVLPAASYRQWVLTVPFPLRLRSARDPGELSRVLNLCHRTLRAELRRRARSAIRHSTIDFTMSIYTDPKLLDVASPLSVLPALRLDAGILGSSARS